MNEKVKEVQQKLVELWKKYDKKQKTLIISITAVVLVTLIILAVILTRPSYKELITCEDTATAAQVTSALDGAGIGYVTENEGLTILVDEGNWEKASYQIAQDGLVATAFTFESYLENSGFSTTSEDKKRMWQKVLEDNMKATLESFDYVKKADVMFSMPNESFSILEKDEETYVSVKLTLSGSVPEGGAVSMAKFIATAVGNDTTNNVTIIDNTGRTLFQGSNSNYSDSGSMSLDEEERIRERFYNEVVNNVFKILSAKGLYTDIAVSPNLSISFDHVSTVDTEYRNPDEVKDSEYIYTQEGGSVSGGVPGTDSNDDDTTYYINTGDSTSSSVEIRKTDYAVSSTITSKDGERGKCDRAASSVAVVVNDYLIYDQDVLEDSGVLDDITWEEFIAQNKDIQELEISDEIYRLVVTATGIPRENIEISGSLIPEFHASSNDGSFVQNIIPIILAVVILALLGFMVWRSLRPIEVNEVEPELSVEELLSATREKQAPVEDIDLEEKSETGKAIEKFVDENPEAAALLLRNWLNDDWG